MSWFWQKKENKVSHKDVDKFYQGYKLIRSRSRWRQVAIVLIVICFMSLITKMGRSKEVSDHIAEIDFRGEIVSPSPYRKIISNVAQSDHVKGILIRMNSGGGEAAESEYLYKELLSLRQQKQVPVVVFIESAAASGAYMISLVGDRIVALNCSAVGSVGALVVVPDVVDLMGKLGVAYNPISSGSQKGQPTPLAHMSQETKDHLKKNVSVISDWFSGLVQQHRKLTNPQVAILQHGAVYIGSEALKLGLIDEISSEANVKAWMDSKVGKKLVYKKYQYNHSDNFFQQAKNVLGLASTQSQSGFYLK